ncbi:glycosyltransferase family 4 protein [Chamaesiphon sp.]|uniref:glycosyltransferase family 4 protein n=1 Tax=Chamaesiphon sp. TaxID=2814140 RepID=UPI0035947B03
MKPKSTTIIDSKALENNLNKDRVIKVFIICSGLGHIKRGYESFTQECFEALSQEPLLDIALFKGGGDSSDKEIVLWNLPRNAPLTQKISWITDKLFGRGAYFLEQSSFFLSLLPHLYFKKLDVVYLSDENLGNLLWHWQRLTKQSYKVLFSNGAPTSPSFLFRPDYVQQVVPVHLETALNAGVPAEKQSLVPHAVNIASELQILTPNERAALRYQLGLPEQQPLLLSVGAINRSHKRMDYVIREVASLPEPRPYLLLLGQQDAESPEIIKLGNELLGTDHFQTRSVALHEVNNYYKIADAFILASLIEGFGRVFLEAMCYGLPCLAHDYEVTRFVLEAEGNLANFELPGSLAKMIPQALAEADNISNRYRIHQQAYNRFSWEKLRPDYVKLIQACTKP